MVKGCGGGHVCACEGTYVRMYVCMYVCMHVFTVGSLRVMHSTYSRKVGGVDGGVGKRPMWLQCRHMD